ncbi:hypothetical protein ADUPG1_008967, partial [Aduncisulcus paluster]
MSSYVLPKSTKPFIDEYRFPTLNHLILSSFDTYSVNQCLAIPPIKRPVGIAKEPVKKTVKKTILNPGVQDCYTWMKYAEIKRKILHLAYAFKNRLKLDCGTNAAIFSPNIPEMDLVLNSCIISNFSISIIPLTLSTDALFQVMMMSKAEILFVHSSLIHKIGVVVDEMLHLKLIVIVDLYLSLGKGEERLEEEMVLLKSKIALERSSISINVSMSDLSQRTIPPQSSVKYVRKKGRVYVKSEEEREEEEKNETESGSVYPIFLKKKISGEFLAGLNAGKKDQKSGERQIEKKEKILAKQIEKPPKSSSQSIIDDTTHEGSRALRTRRKMVSHVVFGHEKSSDNLNKHPDSENPSAHDESSVVVIGSESTEVTGKDEDEEEEDIEGTPDKKIHPIIRKRKEEEEFHESEDHHVSSHDAQMLLRPQHRSMSKKSEEFSSFGDKISPFPIEQRQKQKDPTLHSLSKAISLVPSSSPSVSEPNDDILCLFERPLVTLQS